MKNDAGQVLCRFHLSNLEPHHHASLYEWIVEQARRAGLAGATVFEGFYGMAPDGAILKLHSWPVTQERPVVVEVIDAPRQIEQLLAIVEPAFSSGLITLERAHVTRYRGSVDAAGIGTILQTIGDNPATGVRTMKETEDGVLLRVFLDRSDVDPSTGEPLYQSLVKRAHDARLAGATVLQGAAGCGRHSRIHKAKLLELSSDLPLVIEIVDKEDRIRAFLPTIDALMGEGLATLEAVRIATYGARAVAEGPR